VLETFPILVKRLGHQSSELSGGEQQMLAIARALMTNPVLLLLDEPSEGLAPLILSEIGNVIGSLRTEGISVLMVEHNLSLALGIADYVYVMSKGRIVFEGLPAALCENTHVMQLYLGV